MAAWRQLPLKDGLGRDFVISVPDTAQEALHRVDKELAGHVVMPDPLIHGGQRDRYLVRSLIEESFHSSWIEGAVTTRQAARQMIREGHEPADRSQRMVLNNYLAMERIRQMKDEPFTIDRILEIHHRLTAGTLDDPGAMGRLRRSDEPVQVARVHDGEVLHTPPDADELAERLARLCRFANGEIPDHFIHPVVRAVVVHFQLAYDHPFVDGNGRTARALFYWSMLSNGYWLTEFISISRVIANHRNRYHRAFLFTETDDNDVTYFLVYHLDVLAQAIQELYDYLERKSREIIELDRNLRFTEGLNHRQKALIGNALGHPDERYTIRGHQRYHQVVYQTARTDLFDLVENGTLEQRKVGREFVFFPAQALEEKLGDG